MATPSLLIPLVLLATSLLSEATYYRHHRYIPHFYRYREPAANADNLLPEVSNPVPEVPQPGVTTHSEIPEVIHLAPEVIPEVFHPVPEVLHPAPEAYPQPEVYQPVPEVNTSRVFYGVMFDAGSTGTRIHIYKFIQKDPGSCFTLSLSLLLPLCLPLLGH